MFHFKYLTVEANPSQYQAETGSLAGLVLGHVAGHGRGEPEGMPLSAGEASQRRVEGKPRRGGVDREGVVEVTILSSTTQLSPCSSSDNADPSPPQSPRVPRGRGG